MGWQRPAILPRQVWTRFQGRSKDGAPGQWYEVRDVDPGGEEACIELMLNGFLKDEPLCQALDIKSDPTSRATVRADWETFIRQGISVACYTVPGGQEDGGGELVGFNILLVKRRGDQEELYGEEGGSWLRLLRTLEAAEALVDVFDHYGVDSYLGCSGLTVKPSHRGQNIGGRLLDARKPLCKALGLTVTASVFTAIASQVLAAKCGYELLGTLSYAEMRERGVLPAHPALHTNPCAQLRGTRFTFDD